MVSFREGIGNAVRSAFCALSGPGAATLELGGNIYRGLGGVDQGNDLIASAGLLRNAANVACDRPPQQTTAADFNLPFTGGQCEGDNYRVTYGCEFDGSPVGPFDNTGPGPLEYVTGENPGGGDFIRVLDANGDSLAVCGTSDPEVDVQMTPLNVDNLTNPSDPCGDPPLIPPAYDPDDWTTNVPVVYDDDMGNPQSDDTTITFPPVNFGPGGLVSVPISLTFENGSSLFGDFNLTTGDISIGIGNGNGDGVDETPTEIPEGEDPEEDNLVVIGVRVVAVVVPTSTVATEILVQGSAPNIWAPRLGYVNFKYQTVDGAIGWGPDIPVKNEDNIIWSPRPAVNVSASANKGATFSVFPIVRRANASCSCQ